MVDRLLVSRAKLAGQIQTPSDKSLTHRAVIFAALARPGSTTTIRQPLTGEDCVRTADILGQVGVIETVRSPGLWTINVKGQWNSPAAPLDCGNSGTTMRLLAGVFASQPDLRVRLDGDTSLRRRPMRRVAEPLRLMGARILSDVVPLEINGQKLHGISYNPPVASAQVKSCLLLAGLRSEGTTTISEPVVTRDHTERMLRALGVPCQTGPLVSIEGGADWPGFDFHVPGDISSAAFWIVATAIAGRGEVNLPGIGINPTRTGILEVAGQAGIPVRLQSESHALGEPVADLIVEPPAALKPFQIRGDLVPRLVDEIPILAVLATQCDGETIIRDAADLRVKESDRLRAMASGLAAMGANIEETDDGLIVRGPTKLTGTVIEASGDHRIAMSFAIAGLIADGTTEIVGTETIATSYPNFETDLHDLIV